jgi:hypothetical protein
MHKNPFKFLDSYDKEDKDRFFGRSRETAQLYNALHASNLILLYGASGTGKTSLVNCGLANQFHDSDWLPIFIRRGGNLNESLRRELSKLAPGNGWAADTPVRHRVRELYLEYYRPIYLIFDQFEELYILGGKAEQHRFHRTVAELLQAGLQCKILLIIREEYIAYLSEFEKIVPPLFDNRLRIEKMNDRNLARVITGTLRYGNIKLVDPKTTIPAILDNLRSQREGIDLTNLQVYLDRLWRRDIERQQKSGTAEPQEVTFDPTLVDEVGPMQNVLSDFLDEQMVEVEAGLRRRGIPRPEGLPLEILFTLVTEDGTKRNMNLEGIAEALPRNRKLNADDVAYCLQEFERIKLLRQFAAE